MFGMGMGELLLILVVALLVVGPDKLPNAARAIGKGIRDFRKHTQELQNTLEADEKLGEAVRELKSALRDDPMRVARAAPLRPPPSPTPPAAPPAAIPPPLPGTAVTPAAGAVAKNEASTVVEPAPAAGPPHAAKPAPRAKADG